MRGDRTTHVVTSYFFESRDDGHQTNPVRFEAEQEDPERMRRADSLPSPQGKGDKGARR